MSTWTQSLSPTVKGQVKRIDRAVGELVYLSAAFYEVRPRIVHDLGEVADQLERLLHEAEKRAAVGWQ